MFAARETLFSQLDMLNQCFKEYSANIKNTLRFDRAIVSQKMFPSICPRWET